jgi:hypothetical protein
MPWWATLILVAVILLGIYIAAVFVYIYQMKEYDRRMAKHLEAIDVLIAQKYDLLRRISKIFVQLNISVPSEFMIQTRPKFENTLANIAPEERAIIKSFLMRTAQTLFFYGETIPELGRHKEYVGIKESYAEIDRQYRFTVNIFNADALGYNYWKDFFWFRWVARLRKYGEKDLIT